MKYIPLPRISVDAMSTIKPELIGLAAHLAASGVYGYDAPKILMHVAATGSLDNAPVLCGAKLDAAKLAHSEWMDYLNTLDVTAAIAAARPLIPAPRRNGQYVPVPDDGPELEF